MSEVKQVALRVPDEVKRWLSEEAQRNRSSLNSEVIRAIRERMDRIDQGGRINAA